MMRSAGGGRWASCACSVCGHAWALLGSCGINGVHVGGSARSLSVAFMHTCCTSLGMHILPEPAGQGSTQWPWPAVSCCMAIWPSLPGPMAACMHPACIMLHGPCQPWRLPWTSPSSSVSTHASKTLLAFFLVFSASQVDLALPIDGDVHAHRACLDHSHRWHTHTCCAAFMPLSALLY